MYGAFYFLTNFLINVTLANMSNLMNQLHISNQAAYGCVFGVAGIAASAEFTTISPRVNSQFLTTSNIPI